MDKKYLNDKLLVERYLQDRLSDEEAESFEGKFLSSDELLDELEAAERLRQGLHDISALEYVHSNKWLPSNIVSLFHSPRYAMAATLMLLISMGVSSALLQRNAGLTEPGSNGALATEIFPLISVRGATDGEQNILPLGDVPKQFVMMLDPGFEPYSHYRATVYRLNPGREPARLWQVDRMLPGYEDMLALSIPSSMLSSGDFEIQIEGWRDEWPVDHAFGQLDTKTFTVKK